MDSWNGSCDTWAMSYPQPKHPSLAAAALCLLLPSSLAAQGVLRTQGEASDWLPRASLELVVLDTAVGAPWSAKGPADVTDGGRVVGQAVVSGTTTGYEWTAAGGLQVINSPYSGVGRVNSGGDMAYPLNPLVLSSGQQVHIQNFSGTTSSVQLEDVNDARVVVGRALGSGTTSNVLVWDPVRGSQSFFFPAAKRLVRVNQGTLAVGTATVNTTGSDGFLLDFSTGTTLSFNAVLPAGPNTWSIAVDVNEWGEVVGEGSDGVGLAAFTWRSESGFRFLPGLAGGSTRRVHPTAIDNRGRVVGKALTAANEWRAFLWDPVSGMRDLNDLVVTPPGYVLHEATDLSETGVAIGWGTFGGAAVPQRGFILSGL